MKAALVICMLVAAPFVRAADTTIPSIGPDEIVTGEVLDVMDVPSYTYLLLKTAQGDTWAAVATAPIRKGANVTIEHATVMEDFTSNALSRTFTSIVFGDLRREPQAVAAAHQNVAKSIPDAQVIQVPRASGANARTVAETMANSASLKDQTIVIRGQIVKYSAGIMGKNWIHLRDGSGSPIENTNDVLITTNDEAKVGDIVTVKGVVRTDKDLGSGYFYKVIVEQATLQP